MLAVVEWVHMRIRRHVEVGTLAELSSVPGEMDNSPMASCTTTMANEAPDSNADIESLLPWYAIGALGAKDSLRVVRALAMRPALAEQYAAIRAEREFVAQLNEEGQLASQRILQRLMMAIDAESPSIEPGLLAMRQLAVRFGGRDSCSPVANSYAIDDVTPRYGMLTH